HDAALFGATYFYFPRLSFYFQRSSASNRSPADQPDEDQDDGDHEQDVDEVAERISADHTEQPEDHENDRDSLEHQFSPAPSLRGRVSGMSNACARTEPPRPSRRTPPLVLLIVWLGALFGSQPVLAQQSNTSTGVNRAAAVGGFLGGAAVGLAA